MRRVQPAGSPYRNGELVIVIDCSDLDRSAAFWCAALGYEQSDGSESYRSLRPTSGQGIEVLLQRVPEGKRDEPRTVPRGPVAATAR